MMLGIFSSCKSTAPQFTLYSSFVDYSNYAKDGFFFTESNSVNFNYEPIGSISSSAFSGWSDGSVQVIERNYNDVYGESNKVQYKKEWKWADIHDAMDKAVADAKRMGGNGIINLKTQAIWEFNSTLNQEILKGYNVSGMVIKK